MMPRRQVIDGIGYLPIDRQLDVGSLQIPSKYGKCIQDLLRTVECCKQNLKLRSQNWCEP